MTCAPPRCEASRPSKQRCGAARDVDMTRSIRRAAAVMAVMVVVAAGVRCVAGAATPPLWRVSFVGVRDVRPGMTVAMVRQRWPVRFTFSTGSAPGCKIGGFKKSPVEGGALFQDGKFDAVWFTRGVTTPEGVRIGSHVSDPRRIYGARLQHARNLYDPKRPLYYVRGGSSRWFLEFFPDRSGRITKIGFGDRFVLVQEGCN
jgi:hypothetical protein